MNRFIVALLSVTLSLVAISSHANEKSSIINVAENNSIVRTVDCSGGHVLSNSYKIQKSGRDFIQNGSKEFSFLADGILYSGESNWKDIECSTGGRTVLSMKSEDGRLAVKLIYTTYPDLPLVRKEICITNTGDKDIRIEGVNVENVKLTARNRDSQIYQSYGRFQTLGPYRGDWNDPLLVVYNAHAQYGMAIGNEATGIIKRTSVFEEDGRSIRVGTTLPEQEYPFRRWLEPQQSWTSAPVFTAPFEGRDYSRIVNTTVQDYTRKYMGVRIEQIDHKPLFVYNTWFPFFRNINETMLMEVAEAAAECGIEEFVIDDGWQNNGGSGKSLKKKTSKDDWSVNTDKFPNGLKPVIDHIKKLGMKPGIWLSVGRIDIDGDVAREHPEWIIRDSLGNMTDLHNKSKSNYTACMATEWCDHIKDVILQIVRTYGIEYVKLDLSIVTSAYVFDSKHTGCYATDHKYHRDPEESYDVIYERCMKMFDELHAEAPNLFIDCTFETAGKLQLMDYGIAKHAEGNWLSNIDAYAPAGALRIRELGWVRSPALPATCLVLGNQSMEQPMHILAYKSLTGTLPIMLGDPRKLSKNERAEFKAWSSWIKDLEKRHSIMSFRQDIPGFGMPKTGSWDGFCRINTETCSGGLVGVFREGAAEKSRTITVRDLEPKALYSVKRGPNGAKIAKMTGLELETKGFQVTIEKEYDGELFEVVKIK